MLINEAFAQTAATAPQGGLIEFLTPLVVVVAIFYMLLWRPQSKRMKAHQEMVQALKVGDTVMTTGGIQGTVKKLVDETTVILTVAKDTDITFNRQSITLVMEKPKNTAQKTGKKTPKKATKKAKKAA
jgi:preprotein translocase subunit YajC